LNSQAGMGGQNSHQKYKTMSSTSSNYGEQYSQIQGRSKYVHIHGSFRDELAAVNCETLENPELKVRTGLKCNDYMIVGFYINKSLRYSLVPLGRVSVPRDVCSILTTNRYLKELNKDSHVSIFQLNQILVSCLQSCIYLHHCNAY